jgi:chromosome segregation ATPase
MYTIREEESLAGVSTASSVTTTWVNPKRDESSWQKKYNAEKKINDELRKQVSQRDGEIENIGQQAYKKVEKLRGQREMRDLRIAELEKKLALREEELAKERNKHDNTKVALRGQMEDTAMAREEAAGLKKQVTQLQSRLGLVAQAFGGKNVDVDVGPSISYARRSFSSRAA